MQWFAARLLSYPADLLLCCSVPQQAKVADFGLLREMDSSASRMDITSVVGTPGYVDPAYIHSHFATFLLDVYRYMALFRSYACCKASQCFLASGCRILYFPSGLVTEQASCSLSCPFSLGLLPSWPPSLIQPILPKPEGFVCICQLVSCSHK